MHRARSGWPKAWRAWAAAAAIWKRAARAAIAARSIGITAASVDRVIRMLHTIARRAARRLGAARATGIHTGMSMAAAAYATTAVDRARPARTVDAITVALARRRAAVAARFAAAVPRATTITTSTLGRPWLRRRTRTTRCVARATSCSAIRPRSEVIERGVRV